MLKETIITHIVLLLIIVASPLFLLSCSSEGELDTSRETEKAGETDLTERDCKNEINKEQKEDQQALEPNNKFSDNIDDNSKTDDARHSATPLSDLYVGVYAGKGSWYESTQSTKNFLDNYGIEWSSFDEIDATNLELLNHFDLIWFPGGFAAEYKNYISNHAAIVDFVHDGGYFIGSCAGAYYASDILKWQGTDYQYPLNFFEGKGVGPLSGQIVRGEAASFILEPGHPANQSFNKSIELYYFDGPYFAPYNESSITVLARYEINHEPAVIAGESGEGRYLLFGPHPELGRYKADEQAFHLEGDQGANWPWLYSVFKWFVN
ncbi:MAG: BPL-N domain-containing protein [Bacillota bacterium]